MDTIDGILDNETTTQTQNDRNEKHTAQMQQRWTGYLSPA